MARSIPSPMQRSANARARRFGHTLGPWVNKTEYGQLVGWGNACTKCKQPIAVRADRPSYMSFWEPFDRPCTKAAKDTC